MTEHFTRERAERYADWIRQYWQEQRKYPEVVVVHEEYAGFVVRSNMLNGHPADKGRPVYLPVRDVKMNKRLS